MQELKNRIALIVQYDGTAFNGWQIQENGRTVQEVIEKAIKILTRQTVKLTASGRTDSGVHAFGQVVHFDLEKQIELTRLCIGLNGILPNEISVKNAFLVDPGFHARFSAIQREYIYLVYNHPQKTPFMYNRAMWVNTVLDTEYIRSALDNITGEFDFASFCKKISADEGTVRRIDGCDVIKNGDLLQISIRGNAFLHNMIRIIIGTIVQMSRNNHKPEYIVEIINRKDRNAAGPTAPAYGLYLNSVIYNPSLFTYMSAFNKSEE